MIVNIIYYKSELQYTILERTEKQLFDLRNEIQILFLGDSHILLGIDPAQIENSFNYASGGENYIQTYYKLESLIKEGFMPEIIVLPIDLHSFSSFRTDRFDNEWYWRKFINFYKLAYQERKLFLLNNGINGFFSFKGKGLQLLKPADLSKLSEIQRGYTPSNANFSKVKNRRKVAVDRVASHFEGCEIINNMLLNYFYKILDLAAANNINTVLVKYPLTEEYRNEMKKYIPDEEEYYNSALYKINDYSDIHIFDYQLLYSGNPELFKDSDHLNSAGAVEFSKLLKKSLTDNNLMP
jgi:lysophospholipase L1-like esterase